VDTGYYKSDDPYKDIAAMVPYAVNWQIKESPFGAGSAVRTELKKLLTLIRLGGYRGYPGSKRGKSRVPHGPTVTVALPVMPLTVSVAVRVWLPRVMSVTPPGNVTMPLSVGWKV
jgi:hypothetical protein